MNGDQIACLENYKLQKEQLIWIREVEILAIEEIDEKNIARLELEAKVSDADIANMKHMFAAKKNEYKGEILRAERVIEILTRRIKELSIDTAEA